MKSEAHQVICLKSEAFYALIDEVIAHVDGRYSLPKENQWIGTDEAMDVLKITSKTTKNLINFGLYASQKSII